MIRRTGDPVHLVGHSFGGLAALAVALRGRVPLSWTIAEAPAMEILREAGEMQHYDAFRKMSGTYSDAFKRGETNAIARMIDFYGGAGTFAAWPQRVRDYAIETTRANLLDWELAYGFRLTPQSLATVAVPTLVVWEKPAIRPLAGRMNCWADASRTPSAPRDSPRGSLHDRDPPEATCGPGGPSRRTVQPCAGRRALVCARHVLYCADQLYVAASAHQSDHGRDQEQDYGDKEDRLGDFDGKRRRCRRSPEYLRSTRRSET